MPGKKRKNSGSAQPPPKRVQRYPSKKLVNEAANCVIESIEGLLLASPHLRRLDGFPDVKVVFRVDVESHKSGGKVAVISGGGSGHEPAHAGYVGSGMLTAAVCGEVFASPSVRAVLACLRHVTGPAGCVMIVKNYTGDRLNFGLAAEQAKSVYGLKVEMVVVGDDVALPNVPQPRGIAGTVFVHKAAGHAAEKGGTLAEVAAVASKVAADVGSMGAALTVGALPGQPASDRLGHAEFELGLGIHGEPGRSKLAMMKANDIVDRMVAAIVEARSLSKKDDVALLVNNLGSTSSLEISIVARRAVHTAQVTHGLRIVRAYSGFFMTSLDAAGVSLSLLRADSSVLEALDSSVGAVAWPVGSGLVSTSQPVPLPEEVSVRGKCTKPKPSPQNVVVTSCIRAAMTSLADVESRLTELDKKIGDGDCGTTHKSGAVAVLADLDSHYPVDDPVMLLRALAESVSRSMAGSSGVLYLIALNAAIATMQTHNNPGSFVAWTACLDAGVQAMQKYGGAAVGDRTMIDALVPAVNALRAGSEGDPVKALRNAVDAAREGAASTVRMDASAGRASYVPNSALEGTPDPGAEAVVAWLSGILSVF